jgi:uncharacterized Zn finger protein (UPF0148 family)
MKSNCSVCGEPTQLHVTGKTICVKCEDRADEQRRRGPERAPAVSHIERIMGGGSVEIKSASANRLCGPAGRARGVETS